MTRSTIKKRKYKFKGNQYTCYEKQKSSLPLSLIANC